MIITKNGINAIDVIFIVIIIVSGKGTLTQSLASKGITEDVNFLKNTKPFTFLQEHICLVLNEYSQYVTSTSKNCRLMYKLLQ